MEPKCIFCDCFKFFQCLRTHVFDICALFSVAAILFNVPVCLGHVFNLSVAICSHIFDTDIKHKSVGVHTLAQQTRPRIQYQGTSIHTHHNHHHTHNTYTKI